MSRVSSLSLTIMTVAVAALAAQTASQVQPPAAPPPPPPTLAQLGLIVYPAKDQPKEQQAKDESACSDWATAQTGIRLTAGGAVNTDSAAAASKAQMADATQGAAVAGAAKGAVVGVAIGAIAGDAGTGAAIGAVAGGVAGRRAKKHAEAQAAQAGAKQATQANQAMIDQYKKAASVCLEGRGYTVK